MFGGSFSGYPSRYRGSASVGESLQNAALGDWSHKCSVCSWKTDVDDYQKETPNWCDRCDEIQTFRKIE